jgi:hypothetical protein
LKERSLRLLQEEYEKIEKKILGAAFMDTKIFLCDSMSIAKEMMPEYITNQFKKKGGEFQS